jgi:hypothetical protein
LFLPSKSGIASGHTIRRLGRNFCEKLTVFPAPFRYTFFTDT